MCSHNFKLFLFWSPRILTSDIYGRGEKSKIMSSDEEKEDQIAEYFLKSFEEKSPLDYDILDSMPIKVKQGVSQIPKTDL